MRLARGCDEVNGIQGMSVGLHINVGVDDLVAARGVLFAGQFKLPPAAALADSHPILSPGHFTSRHVVRVCLFTVGLVFTALVAPAEPPGPGVLFSESFDDVNLSQRKWYDGDRFRIVGGAWGGPGCIEYEWRQGDAQPVGSSGVRHLIEPTDEVWLRFHLKFSKGWGWTGRNYHPHLMHFMTTANSPWHGPAASHLTLYTEPVNGRLRLAATDIQNQDSPHGLTQGPLKGGFNGMFCDSPEELFTDDQWHCIEACFKLNTLDLQNDRPNRDGIIRGWFDGKLVVEHTNVVLRSTDFPAMKINQFLMTPYFGPGLLPHPQKLWVDEVAVGTKRLAPAPAGGAFWPSAVRNSRSKRP